MAKHQRLQHAALVRGGESHDILRCVPSRRQCVETSNKLMACRAGQELRHGHSRKGNSDVVRLSWRSIWCCSSRVAHMNWRRNTLSFSLRNDVKPADMTWFYIFNPKDFETIAVEFACPVSQLLFLRRFECEFESHLTASASVRLPQGLQCLPGWTVAFLVLRTVYLNLAGLPRLR